MATAAHLPSAVTFDAVIPRGGLVIPETAPAQVMAALNDPEYRWRTVERIAQDTGLSETVVRFVLSNLPLELIVRTPSTKGWLYTTRRHYDQTKTLKSRILSVLSDLPK